jgi:hypothetical protein
MIYWENMGHMKVRQKILLVLYNVLKMRDIFGIFCDILLKGWIVIDGC